MEQEVEDQVEKEGVVIKEAKEKDDDEQEKPHSQNAVPPPEQSAIDLLLLDHHVRLLLTPLTSNLYLYSLMPFNLNSLYSLESGPPGKVEEKEPMSRKF